MSVVDGKLVELLEESAEVGLLNPDTEFISKALDLWAYENNVTLDFLGPGKPTDNSFIESFNGSFRDECSNLNWFLSLDDAQQKIEAWRVDYNEYRPHQSLNDRTPQEFVTENHQADFF